MTGAMNFSFGDLYPGMTAFDTTQSTNPDAEQQAALNENADTVKEAASKGSRPRFIFMALGLIVLLTVFFGVD